MFYTDPARTLEVVVIGPDSVTGRLYVDALKAQGAAVSIVGVVGDEADAHLLPDVPAFASFDLLAANLMGVDLVVLAEAANPAAVVALALERGWHVLSAWMFTDDRKAALDAFRVAQVRNLMLRLGFADRLMVTNMLSEVPDEPSEVGSITARRLLRLDPDAAPPSAEELLLGREGGARLARALVTLESGKVAVVTAQAEPMVGVSARAIIDVEGGPVVTIVLGEGVGYAPTDEELKVRTTLGSMTLALPGAFGAPAPAEPPSTGESAGGWHDVLTLLPIGLCHLQLVSEVLEQVRSGKRDPGADLRLVRVVGAMRRSLANGGVGVRLTLP